MTQQNFNFYTSLFDKNNKTVSLKIKLKYYCKHILPS